MPIQGPPSHIDISVGEPGPAIAFYGTLLEALGYRRMRVAQPDFEGDVPLRACWAIEYPGGGWFGIEVRPASGPNRARAYDRYAPGPHHTAFHADSPASVDAVHARMVEGGFRVLDPPTDYSGHPAYSEGYYAAFFADPDGYKIEVVYEPRSNP